MKDDTKYDDSEESSDGEIMCMKCGNSPCELTNMKESLLNEAKIINSTKTYKDNENNLKRKRMYKHYAQKMYGKLGENVRVPISPCIMDFIRSIFPSPDGKYMGFKVSRSHINELYTMLTVINKIPDPANTL